MAYPITRYLNVQQAYSPHFTADGTHILFISTITGTPQLWRVPASSTAEATLWPEQLTFDNERVLGVWTSPVAGDSRLIFARDTGGDENAGLFLLEPDTGYETALTAGHAGIMHTFGAWSSDGRQIVFAANRRNRAHFDLYLQPLDGKAQIIWRHDEPGFLTDAAFSPDGTRLLVVRRRSSFEHDLFELDLQTGTVSNISPGTGATRYEAVDYAADGHTIILNTDLDADFLHIVRLHRENGDVTSLIRADWDIEHMTAAPDGRHLAYCINQDGQSLLCLLDLETGKTRTAPRLDDAPGVVAWLDARLHFSADASRLVFSFTSATRTSDIWVWEPATEKVTAVTRSAHGGLLPSVFVAPELVRYPTFDGRAIPAWFYRPQTPDSEPAPAIVVVHGGPESQFVPYFHFFVQFFVNNGFAALAPNVRGSTGYGKPYSHLDDVRRRMDSVADLAHAAHWLKQQACIDGRRLVVYGGSYGGFMVLAALTTYPDLWAAGVDIVGISSFVTFLERTSSYRRQSREAEYGSLEHDREFLESIAPINHVDKIRVPLMVIHGANDPRVPLGEAEQLVAALRQREVPVELLVFDDEGHGVIKLKNKQVAYPAIIDFLAKHLLAT
ncbi:MAG TPA: S9 family peptidase [Herpetosiphonaceae bacterium]|nr:S9 family peptidase [Herpetosiphonaceae bacterium]